MAKKKTDEIKPLPNYKVANPRCVAKGWRIFYTPDKEYFEGDEVNPFDFSKGELAYLVETGKVVEV